MYIYIYIYTYIYIYIYIYINIAINLSCKPSQGALFLPVITGCYDLLDGFCIDLSGAVKITNQTMALYICVNKGNHPLLWP